METTTVTYTIIMEPAPGGGWNALVPDLPGLLLAGETKDALLASAPDAILDYVETMRESGNPVPTAATEAAHVTVSFPAA
jgi:predicted RNase H-like HicB family nuclease